MHTVGNRFCSFNVTEDATRGTYNWQETVGGSTYTEPQLCVYGDSGMALRNCTQEGIWEAPDLSQCITVFEDLARVSHPGTKQP